MEFALVLPLFLVLLLSTVDIGRLMVTWSGMANGAREATRRAALTGESGPLHTEAEIRQSVANFVLGVSAPAFEADRHVAVVCRDEAGAAAACTGRTSRWTVEVVVAYPFTPLPLFSSPLGSLTSFGLGPFTQVQCEDTYAFASQTFDLNGQAGCLVLTTDALGYVE